ncbi:Uncharacterised protein [Streptomyces griseus]|uniref:Uncharacterized protein n=1 Tax=Streptomyces griseus TaxID=1911 RepID=A0A380P3B7_STRGR|nr:Uncharacterised protein [Streptomyces griseus]
MRQPSRPENQGEAEADEVEAGRPVAAVAQPGSRKSRPWPLRAAAVLSIRPKSPEERSSASTVSVAVPLISSTDLTIWI